MCILLHTQLGIVAFKWDLSKVADPEATGHNPRWLVVNVGFDPETVKSSRGKRFKVGYWMRLGKRAQTNRRTRNPPGPGYLHRLVNQSRCHFFIFSRMGALRIRFDCGEFLASIFASESRWPLARRPASAGKPGNLKRKLFHHAEEHRQLLAPDCERSVLEPSHSHEPEICVARN